jgi:ATP-dependent DNA helicase RecG
MPSALETLVKILKLEREQGCKNTAVIGGIAAFGEKWTQDAHKQAKKPEHHLLVDELAENLRGYEGLEGRPDRQNRINYMLDRITGRVEAPPQYRYVPPDSPPGAEQPADSAAAPAESPPRQRPERERREQRQDRPRPERTEQSPSAESEERPRTDRRDNQTQGERREQRQDRPRTDRRQPEAGGEAGSTGQQNQPARQSRPDQRDNDRRDNKKKRPERDTRPQQGRGRQQRTDDDDDDDEREPAGGGFFERDELSYDNYDAPVRDRKGKSAPTIPDIQAPVRLARVPRRPRPSINLEQSADLLRALEQPVSVIKGIGPAMQEMLGRLGIHQVKDLLFRFPRRYDDYTHIRTIARLTPDENLKVTVIGTVEHAEVRVAKKGRRDFFLVLDDGTARMGITFFGQHWLARSIRQKQQIVVSGTTSMYGNRIQMVNPEWEPLDVENLHTVGIIPVYNLTEGLGAKTLRKLIRSGVDYWSERIPDHIPEATLERTELADLGWALKHIHFPEGPDHLRHAQRRFTFDELLLLQLAVLRNRRAWQSVPGQPIRMTDEFLETFLQHVFPYPLTGAQRRSIEDIRRDAQSNLPMNRLLQGDVGSGKTAVATAAIGLALINGKQAALMVPTSILAEQHYRNIEAALHKMPDGLMNWRRPVVALLTGSLSTTERESIYRGMADGSIDVVIGTHALIQEGVEFNDLAVAIIDEQHRFGVEQRGALRGKGTNPHLLVMTATPIPRTLALTIFADLDLSIINEFPPGRIPIRTRVVDPVNRERVFEFVEEELKKGRQAFVVHPLVEESEKIDAPAAVEAYDRLKDVFHRYKVGLLHGRMRPAEKDEVMAAFSTGEYDVLVTTSVAEVGVNVPNATVMVIEGANRFGLAQLHQFRGRVGRGEHASYCLLLSDTNDTEARERLQALESTTDGFQLAEMDWQMRGAGDLVGTQQSGGSKLQLAQVMTPELVELAQREARTIYEEDPDLTQEQHFLLAERVAMQGTENTDVS